MKWNYAKIKAQAFDRETGEKIGRARTEKIDLPLNEMFKGVETILDIKNAFESYWNNLNPNSKEIVFCQEILVG